MKKLTPKQQEVFAFLKQYQEENGYPPTVREICAALGFKSPSTAHFHLEGLINAGYLVRDEGKTRALKIVGYSAERRAKVASERREMQMRVNEVPLLGHVAAGSPILAEQNVEELLYFDTNGLSGEHFALRVRGESMLGAGIMPGDLVIVHQQQEVRNGQIVVALFEDEATVKTYSTYNGEIWLLPENDAYEPIDGQYAQIIGRVVGLVRRY